MWKIPSIQNQSFDKRPLCVLVLSPSTMLRTSPSKYFVLSAVKGFINVHGHFRVGLFLAGAAGDRIAKGLAGIFERNKPPFVAFNHGSIVHMENGAAMLMNIKNPNLFKEVGARKKVMEEMGAALMAEGIITLAGSRLYTSMADTDDVIDDALERMDRLFRHIEVKKE